jgi:hypothetical protein
MQSVFAAPCCTVLTKLRLKNHFALPGHGETGQYEIINQKNRNAQYANARAKKIPSNVVG